MSISEYERVPIIRSLAEDPDLPARLKALWETKPGLYGWISSVDHKTIGIRYLVTSFIFLILGGLEALLMRIQLAQPGEHVVTAEQYNQLFSMHGITMIFPLCAAGTVGIFQLPVSSRAGRQGHGVSSSQRVFLLDLSWRRPVYVCKLPRRGSPR